MIIDHIGIVVKDIEDGVEHWSTVFGYNQITEIVLNTRQKVKVVFMEKENSSTIKLIEPTDETSPVHNFALNGGGLHHLCFKCSDMGAELGNLRNHGFRITARPQPGEAFENEKISFLYSKQGVNIELIDTDKRAKRILK